MGPHGQGVSIVQAIVGYNRPQLPCKSNSTTKWMVNFSWTTCRGGRIRIDTTRLFLPPPTTTLMTSDVVVNQLVLFTVLQSFFRIPEE